MPTFSPSLSTAFMNDGESLEQFEERLLRVFRDLHRRHSFEVRRFASAIVVVDLVYGTEWNVPLTPKQ